MSARLNHARTKSLTRARRNGEKDQPHRRSVQGWRTEYPEEFPVTVTRTTPIAPHPQQDEQEKDVAA